MQIGYRVSDSRWFRQLAKPLRDGASIRRWTRDGRPVPPPAPFKQRLVREYGKRFGIRTLVETGTAAGEMVAACLDVFERIESIELDPFQCERAQRRFARFEHVRIRQGDSGKVLGRVLEGVSEPCLFWLDGHAMEGGWRLAKLTPIREELDAVLSHGVAGHVVLIDDVRLFDGLDDYPELGEVRETIRERRPEWVVEVADDVLRAHPPE